MTNYKRGRRGKTLPVAIHLKFACQYFEEFCDEGMSREPIKGVWAWFNANGTESETIPPVKEQNDFIREAAKNRTGDLLKKLDDAESR